MISEFENDYGSAFLSGQLIVEEKGIWLGYFGRKIFYTIRMIWLWFMIIVGTTTFFCLIPVNDACLSDVDLIDEILANGSLISLVVVVDFI